jgi:hypothetical protein
MTYDPQYLGRNLTNRVREALTVFQTEITAILSQAASHGAAQGSRVYVQYRQHGIDVLKASINDAAQFAYNLTGEHTGEVFRQVEHCAKLMIDAMMNAIIVRAGQSNHYGEIVGKTRIAFQDTAQSLLDDFKNGMMGSNRLKKDPVVSIVANQSNSPGGIQQVGVGDFSQAAFVDNRKQIIEAIDAALVSSEFESLDPTEKEGVRDIAEVVKDEAEKVQPDGRRLKRWGSRLVEIMTDVGMKVAAGAIAALLVKVFVG